MKGKYKDLPEMVIPDTEGLPKAIVRCVVKDTLSQLSHGSDIPLVGESLDAFCVGGRVFIHSLSAAANEICKDSNRHIITAEDVFKALEELEFPEFDTDLRSSLEEFREKNAEKKSKAGLSRTKDTEKKGKRRVPAAKHEGRSKQKRRRG
ncbi:DNA polymerase II subunit B4-like isoform X2 [Andrographis paniculata]|uniref:DNA polymerase II subunit B4-like isoform X2 n=1 Tax=Andrographis paniculata TaxID=175694 RepID=UPI0021E72046|nr:DNA polymerase II subunit B4-like isoform X2 [Andrographis paniculata]